VGFGLDFCLNPRLDFCLTRKEPTVLFLEEVSEHCGKKRRESSRTVSTKSLPQCVCSILSISKARPPVHSFVVCSYLAQPYPHTLRTIAAVGVLYILLQLVFCTYLQFVSLRPGPSPVTLVYHYPPPPLVDIY
jgi:hypothetical protein